MSSSISPIEPTILSVEPHVSYAQDQIRHCVWPSEGLFTYLYMKNPTNTKAIKLKKAQYQLTSIYLKEQTEYIRNPIDKIRDSVEDRQSKIAWQTINEVSKRKTSTKAKLKAANQQERIKLWKQHFENQLGNQPKVTHEPITRIISKQLDIKLGPFPQEEHDSVLKKKIGKLQGLTRFPHVHRMETQNTSTL